MQYSILKFSNGETVIAEVLSTKKKLVIKNPMLVKSGVDQTNQLIITLIDWIDTDQPYIMVNDNHLVTMAKPSAYILDYYKSSVIESKQYTREKIDNDDDFEEYETGTHTVH